MGPRRLSPTVPFRCPDRSPGRLRQKCVPPALPHTGMVRRRPTDPRADHTDDARSPYRIVRGNAIDRADHTDDARSPYRIVRGNAIDRADHTDDARSPYRIVRGNATASQPFRIYHQSPGLSDCKNAQPVPSSTGSHKRSQTRPRSKYAQPVPSHTGRRRISQTGRLELPCRCRN